MTEATWTAPVRYSEADQQGVVFNSHYLLYCDEAMGSFCNFRGLDQMVENVRLKTSTITWHAAATWGDVVEVRATCTKVGTTSLAMHFDIAVGDRECCSVETVYVNADGDGRPMPLTDAERGLLLA